MKTIGTLFRASGAVLLGTTVLLAGCDVTNPGPVSDEFLAVKASHAGLVNGAGRRLAEAVNGVSYTGALISREIFPGGQTGSLGHPVLVQGGWIEPGSYGGHFNDAVQSRFIAESAIKILTESEEAPDPNTLAQAYLWAGYAYRVIAENWCETVIPAADGSPGSLVSSTAPLAAAEQHFSNAISTATDNKWKLAGYAGRAQINLWMGDWSGASGDASQITDDSWSFDLNMSNLDNATRNQLWFANDNSPYRAFSMIYTYYGGNQGLSPNPPAFVGYTEATGDPRTPVATTSETWANAALEGFGQVPFLNSLHYTSGDDDIRLASGNEMRLIEAEAMLNTGQWSEAMTLINQVRANAGMNDLFTDYANGLPAASDVATAMSYLMRERGIELWGEARRWGDQRRWETGGLGGDQQLADFETTTVLFTTTIPERSRCLDVPDAERESNPNVPTVGG